MVSSFEARIKAGTPFTPVPKKRTKQQEEEATTRGEEFIQRREELTADLGSRQRAERALTRESERTPEAMARRQLEVQAIQAQRDLELVRATPSEQLFKTPTQKEISQSLPQEEINAPLNLENVKNVFKIEDQKGALISAIKQGVPEGLSNAGDILDTLRKTITGGKRLNVQQAENSLTAAIQLIQADVDAVRRGELSPSQARADYLRAQSKLNALAGSQKQIGKIQTTVWATRLKEVEEEVEINKRILERLGVELEVASIQSQINLQGGR